MHKKTINIKGQLLDLSVPKVMGILNLTPDSFYAGSRTQTEEAIARRLNDMARQGADLIDVGACSTRPGGTWADREEEMSRLRTGLEVIRREQPTIPLSVDTFRADVARMCVEEYDVDMVNDISGGELDAHMFSTVAQLQVPYVLTHGLPVAGGRDVLSEVVPYLARKTEQLHSLLVNDVVIDPGFGFGKTMEQNYELLAHLNELRVLDQPLLVGVSRKSMIYKPLNITPQDALNGTTVLHTLALAKGAGILRAHDVAEAVQAVKLFALTHQFDYDT